MSIIEHVGFFAELGASLIAVVALLFLVIMLLRSHKIPECFSCGAMKVRPSRAVGFWDTVALAFQVRPHRCEGCRERFYALRIFGDSRKPSIQAQRIVKVAFRFHYGLPNRIAIRVIDKRGESNEASSDAVSGRPAILQI